MTNPPAEVSTDDVMEQLRQMWVTASADSIGRDIRLARVLVETVPQARRAEADAFVVALERLDRWLRDF